MTLVEDLGLDIDSRLYQLREDKEGNLTDFLDRSVVVTRMQPFKLTCTVNEYLLDKYAPEWANAYFIDISQAISGAGSPGILHGKEFPIVYVKAELKQ